MIVNDKRTYNFIMFFAWVGLLSSIYFIFNLVNLVLKYLGAFIIIFLFTSDLYSQADPGKFIYIIDNDSSSYKIKIYQQIPATFNNTAFDSMQYRYTAADASGNYIILNSDSTNIYFEPCAIRRECIGYKQGIRYETMYSLHTDQCDPNSIIRYEGKIKRI